MKLLIGIPTAGSPAAPFLASLAKLALPAGISGFDRVTVSGNFVPAQRELILRRAIAAGCDLVAMIDDDIVLPPDALVQLAQALDADPSCGLAGALYYSRDGLRPMAVAGWNHSQTTDARTPAFDDRTPVRVDGVGFGCVLLRVNALQALTQPFVGAQVYVEENANRVRICNEDYIFCERLRAAGFGVLLHPGVRCGHYDRSTANVIPERWESPHVTSRERMAVVSEGGLQTLVPFDASVRKVRERHISAALEYIFFDGKPET